MWKKLFHMQKELDKFINENNQIEKQDLFSQKCLALLVELGELANETRCFKFWSKQSRSEREVVLEEYVDGIHFILSIGLDQNMSFTSQPLKESSRTEVEQFHEVFSNVITFKQSPTYENYERLFISYLQLGKLLGFTEADIEKAYDDKNKINFKRQLDGY